MTRLLVVEDVARIAEALKRGLEAEGYAVDVLHDGGAAERRFQSHRAAPESLPYDLVILDVMLPGVDGRTLCRELRGWGYDLPVLMLTARDAVADRVAGLDAGADDYLVKPFAFEELLARLRTLLRRPAQALPPTLVVDDLELDPVSHEVRRGGATLTLSPKEYGILELFMRAPGRVFTREAILAHVWDDEYDSFSNTVDVYIARLRRKIDDGQAPSRLETVRGAGYRLRHG